MKRSIIFFSTLLLFMFISMPGIFAQGGPGEPPEDPADGGGGPIGGNAPIASGLTILLTLAAAYGGRKTYSLYKQEIPDN